MNHFHSLDMGDMGTDALCHVISSAMGAKINGDAMTPSPLSLGGTAGDPHTLSGEDSQGLDVDSIYQDLAPNMSWIPDNMDLYLECNGDDDAEDKDCIQLGQPHGRNDLIQSGSGKRNDLMDTGAVFHIPAGNMKSYKVTVPVGKDGKGKGGDGSAERFACDICSKSFTRESLLKDHRAKLHGFRDQFHCSLCPYKGQLHRHLTKHFKRKHCEGAGTNKKKKVDIARSKSTGVDSPLKHMDTTNADGFGEDSLDRESLLSPMSEAKSQTSSDMTLVDSQSDSLQNAVEVLPRAAQPEHLPPLRDSANTMNCPSPSMFDSPHLAAPIPSCHPGNSMMIYQQGITRPDMDPTPPGMALERTGPRGNFPPGNSSPHMAAHMSTHMGPGQQAAAAAAAAVAGRPPPHGPPQMPLQQQQSYMARYEQNISASSMAHTPHQYPRFGPGHGAAPHLMNGTGTYQGFPVNASMARHVGGAGVGGGVGVGHMDHYHRPVPMGHVMQGSEPYGHPMAMQRGGPGVYADRQWPVSHPHMMAARPPQRMHPMPGMGGHPSMMTAAMSRHPGYHNGVPYHGLHGGLPPDRHKGFDPATEGTHLDPLQEMAQLGSRSLLSAQAMSPASSRCSQSGDRAEFPGLVKQSQSDPPAVVNSAEQRQQSDYQKDPPTYHSLQRNIPRQESPQLATQAGRDVNSYGESIRTDAGHDPSAHGVPARGSSANGSPANGTYVSGTSVSGTSSDGISVSGTSSNGISVSGTSSNGTSVSGTSKNGISVSGTSSNSTSVSGTSNNGTSVSCTSNNGIYANNTSTSSSSDNSTADAPHSVLWMPNSAEPMDVNQDCHGESETFAPPPPGRWAEGGALAPETDGDGGLAAEDSSSSAVELGELARCDPSTGASTGASSAADTSESSSGGPDSAEQPQKEEDAEDEEVGDGGGEEEEAERESPADFPGDVNQNHVGGRAELPERADGETGDGAQNAAEGGPAPVVQAAKAAANLYQCVVCAKSFSNRTAMYGHTKIVHSQSRPHACDQPDCGKSFKTAKALQEHRVTVHGPRVRLRGGQ